MLNSLKHKDLVHKSFDGAVFTTNSVEVNDYLRDPNYVALSATHMHYVGFTKPFTQLFTEICEASDTAAELTIEYWDGSAWAVVPNLFDDTKGASRSGFLRWEFEDSRTIKDDWQTTTVDSSLLYWIRISSALALGATSTGTSLIGSTDTIINLSNEDIVNYTVGQYIRVGSEAEYSQVSAIDYTTGAANITLVTALTVAPTDETILTNPPRLDGLNIVFCDDQDLESVNPRIRDFLFKGQKSFINYRVEASKQIIQTFRNGGWAKMFATNSQLTPNVSTKGLGQLRNMTKWDVLDIDEVREAAKHLTLSKIFFEVSENVGDKSYSRYTDYQEKFAEAFKVFFLTLDLDDDGEVDAIEEMSTTDLEIIRI